jgi:hypothetical protein
MQEAKNKVNVGGARDERPNGSNYREGELEIAAVHVLA